MLVKGVPIGATFEWKGRIWRRGRGIIYTVKPCCAGLIYESYVRRRKKRSRITW